MGPAFFLKPASEKTFCYGNNIPLFIRVLPRIFAMEQAALLNPLRLKDKAPRAPFGMVVAYI
jgi:hypothetical protein